MQTQFCDHSGCYFFFEYCILRVEFLLDHFWENDTMIHWFKNIFFKKPIPSQNNGTESGELSARIEVFLNEPLSEVMVHRSDIVAVSYQFSFQEVVKAFLKTGFRWLPVYRDTLDHITGAISIHGVFALRESSAEEDKWYRYLNHASFVPSSMTVKEAMSELYDTHGVALFIVDEYGGVEGMVTKGHILKEFRSAVLGQAPEEEDMIISKDPWVIRGRMGLEEFNEEFQPIFTASDEDRVNTIGGWLCAFLGRVPLKGEIIDHPLGFSFEIKQADPRKIYEITILTQPLTVIPSVSEEQE